MPRPDKTSYAMDMTQDDKDSCGELSTCASSPASLRDGRMRKLLFHEAELLTQPPTDGIGA